jgi:PAS domain S-box-containing protein
MPYLKNAFDLDYFFNLSPDLLCIAGNDGYFKKINPAVAKTLGYTEEELFEHPIDFFIYEEDKDITRDKRALLKKGIPLLNFENRYVTKSGDIVWLSWTSMPVIAEKVVFAIAKVIKTKKKFEEYQRISEVIKQFKPVKINNKDTPNLDAGNDEHAVRNLAELSSIDKHWLNEFEKLVKLQIKKGDLTITNLSADLALSERQVYRRIKSILGITPNAFIFIIRLELAKEIIKTGKFRTVAEISHAVGFETPAYFNKLFKKVYGRDVADMLGLTKRNL